MDGTSLALLTISILAGASSLGHSSPSANARGGVALGALAALRAREVRLARIARRIPSL